MKRFSENNYSKVVNFIIDKPKISFDYLLGLYLSIFKKAKWKKILEYLIKKV